MTLAVIVVLVMADTGGVFRIAAQHLFKGVFEETGGRLAMNQGSEGANNDRSGTSHCTILAHNPAKSASGKWAWRTWDSGVAAVLGSYSFVWRMADFWAPSQCSTILLSLMRKASKEL